MHMHLTDERAPIDRIRSRRESSDRPMLLLLGSEFRVLVRKFATGGRSAVARSFLGRGIYVPPVSGTWLRIYEAEYHKHGAAV